MNQQPSDQPDSSAELPEEDGPPRLRDVVRDLGLIGADKFRELARKQVAVITLGSAARREPSEALRYATSVEAQAVEMQDNGRVSKQVAHGTTLTPDQDVLEMDATIPSSPNPPADE